MSDTLLTRANAVHGFRIWLASNLPSSDIIRQEFDDQLSHVLKVYECELDRQINGEPATPDWFQLVAIDAQLVELLQDELLYLYPQLATYQPSDDPRTIPQMTAKLLADARKCFEQSIAECSEHLERPLFPAVLDNLLRLIDA